MISEMLDSTSSCKLLEIRQGELHLGPLSDSICPGMPCVADKCLRATIVLAVVVYVISTTSVHFECAFNTIRKD